MEKAVFAAGCFWGVEQQFASLPGVVSTTVGYSGGTLASPSYKDVCSGKTGHAEVVLVEFDAKKIIYRQLLGHFWKIHDPTTLNRQGPDVGTQYRSAIFYHDQRQKEEAEQSKKSADGSGRFSARIVTEITAASTFYPAEDHHQKYWVKNPGYACRLS